jgi:hypothetical protein
VLDVEVAVLQAELDRTRAVAAVRLAEARLARASGDAAPGQPDLTLERESGRLPASTRR